MMDQPVAINAIKRAASDRAPGRWEKTVKAAPLTGRRVAVVGSGPAGLTATYYLATVKGHGVTLFEVEEQLGGQLRLGIPPYRLPREILDREIGYIVQTRVDVRTKTRIHSPQELLRQGYDAVFLAIGSMQTAPSSNNQEGTECYDFLRRANLGIARGLTGQRVVILGGTNVAFDGARMALRLGAESVSILFEGEREEVPAYGFEVKAAEQEGVQLRCGVLVTQVRPREDGHILTVSQRKATTHIECDLLLMAGQRSPRVPEQWGMAVNGDGTIEVNSKTLETNCPGVFAGGDAVTGPLNIIDAMAAGRLAASSIDRYLGGDGNIAEAFAPTPGDELEMPTLLAEHGTPTTRMRELPVATRVSHCKEVELGYTAEEAIQEARRCIRCDLWRIGVPEVFKRMLQE